ncbi:3-methyl-2-oxobutanoate hydroxymethyltransferase [Smittium culicis]|uniref:3-methyl-2-oxobutanoate hydroxymethyltransferase n=1 Tax=Smittium culicis TaxID=133412 RepID=A0A1R1YKX7_9FUNG|nr:3-methyl-2-oxobutanoate hydroxymethyltransferase [Smittium culicis]
MNTFPGRARFMLTNLENALKNSSFESRFTAIKSKFPKNRSYSAQPINAPKKKTIIDLSKNKSRKHRCCGHGAGRRFARNDRAWPHLDAGSDDKRNDPSFEGCGARPDPADARRRHAAEGKAEMVKLEGGNEHIIDRIRHVVGLAGVPVCGHIGLTPQSTTQLGGFRVQGKTPAAAASLLAMAHALETAGCSMIVLEAVPELVARGITKLIGIPTFGIGAGTFTSGQIAVLPDIANLSNVEPTQLPKFVKVYANAGQSLSSAVDAFTADVNALNYPNKDLHIYNVNQKTSDEIRDYFLKTHNIEV